MTDTRIIPPNLTRLLLYESMDRSNFMDSSTTSRDIAILRVCYGGHRGIVTEALVLEAKLIVEGILDLVRDVAQFLGAPDPKELLKKSVSYITDNAPKAWSFVKKKFGDLTKFAEKAWGWILANVPFAEEIVEFLKMGVEKVADLITKAIEPLKEKVDEFVKNICEKIANLFLEQIEDLELSDSEAKKLATAAANESVKRRRDMALLNEQKFLRKYSGNQLAIMLFEQDDDEDKGAETASGIKDKVLEMINKIRDKGANAVIKGNPREFLASVLEIITDMYALFLDPPKLVMQTRLGPLMAAKGKQIQKKLSEYFSLFASAGGAFMMKVSQILAASKDAAKYILKSAKEMLGLAPEVKKDIERKVTRSLTISMFHGGRAVKSDVASPEGFSNLLIGLVKGSLLEDLAKIGAAAAAGAASGAGVIVGAKASANAIKDVVTRIFRVIIEALKEYATNKSAELGKALDFADEKLNPDDEGAFNFTDWAVKTALAYAGIKVED